MTIYKEELYQQVADRNNWLPKYGEVAVNSVIDCIIDNIAAGNDVQITNFCSFKIKEYKSKMICNIDGSGMKKIPKRKKVCIKPGKLLALAVQRKRR